MRKSRGDEEIDLQNHLAKLIEIAKGYEWEYELYKEIGSGGSIDDRPVMLNLLRDIEAGEYDGVLVFDVDRLTRGGGGDQERLYYILRSTDTKIITGAPYDILDPQDDGDIDMLNMKSFFSNMELRTIKKRFRHGKVIGASKGNWVYGRAPFGYVYDRESKRLKVHPEEGEVVKRIVKEFIETNKSTGDIAWELNSEKIKSKSGLMWNNSMVRSILQTDTYSGNTTYNKSEGTHHSTTKNKYSITPYKALPKSEWKTIYNTHEPLVTPEQRQKIDVYYNEKRRKAKPKKDGGVFDLSGLCKTPYGDSYTRTVLPSGREFLIFHKDSRMREEGRYPKHMYVDTEIVRNAIKHSVKMLEKELIEKIASKDVTQELEHLQTKLKDLSRQHEIVLNSFERIIQGYINQFYDESTMKRLKVEKESEQREIELNIRETKDRIDSFSNSQNEERLSRVEKLIEDMKSVNSGKKMNTLYKSMIKSIIVERTDKKHINVKINFL